MKRILTILLMVGAGLLFAVASAGCGDEAAQQTAQPAETAPRTVVEQDPLQQKIDELEQTAFTVTITSPEGGMPMFAMPLIGPDRDTQVTYSQNGKGSWRIDRPQTFIYNAEEKKIWNIQGNTAWEYPVPEEYPQTPIDYSPSPVAEILAMTPPRIGPSAVAPTTAGKDGIWEWIISPTQDPGGGVSFGGPGWSWGFGAAAPPPGITGAEQPGGADIIGPPAVSAARIRLEFKGPEGLLSKFVIADPMGSVHEQVFDYSNVGEVSEDLFNLPADVEEVRIYNSGPGSSPPFTPYGPGFGR